MSTLIKSGNIAIKKLHCVLNDMECTHGLQVTSYEISFKLFHHQTVFFLILSYLYQTCDTRYQLQSVYLFGLNLFWNELYHSQNMWGRTDVFDSDSVVYLLCTESPVGDLWLRLLSSIPTYFFTSNPRSDSRDPVFLTTLHFEFIYLFFNIHWVERITFLSDDKKFEFPAYMKFH